MAISENLENVRAKIKEAAVRSGRKQSDITLVAVTKKSSVSEINEALLLGVNAIGENRVEAAAEKFPLLSQKVEKHMIGHLQTNKAKAAVSLFDVIQSVDSLKLAKEIDKRAKEIGKVMPIMIEINISSEEQKYGISPDYVDEFYGELKQLPNIKVIGLMAMAPLVPAEQTRPYFKKMKQIFDKLNLNSNNVLEYLSMGMTNDYEVAIEEGANMVRVGTGVLVNKKDSDIKNTSTATSRDSN